MIGKSALVDRLEKTITLGDIAPKWAKRLEQKRLPFPLSFRWFKWYFELDIPSNALLEKHMVLVHRTRRNARSVIFLVGNLDPHFWCAQNRDLREMFTSFFNIGIKHMYLRK